MSSDLFVALLAGRTFLEAGALQDRILAETLLDVQDRPGKVFFLLFLSKTISWLPLSKTLWQMLLKRMMLYKMKERDL